MADRRVAGDHDDTVKLACPVGFGQKWDVINDNRIGILRENCSDTFAKFGSDGRVNNLFEIGSGDTVIENQTSECGTVEFTGFVNNTDTETIADSVQRWAATLLDEADEFVGGNDVCSESA